MKRRARILVVDDEAFNVDYLEQELEELEYDTISAVNGVDALTKMQAEHPDLVLLDIMMPIMDGFAVLRQAKADPLLRDVPIIVISAMNDLDSVVKGIALGAEDYLPKPFEPTLLQARIAASLEKKRLRDEQRRLLHTFASKEVAETLVAEGFSLGGKRIDASIMFTDIRSFTTISETRDPAETIELLNRYFAVVFEPIARYGGIVNQIIGDGMMALFGITRRSVVSASNVDHRQHAVLAAIAILDALRGFNEQLAASDQQPIRIGIGIASGSVIAGYAGTKHRATYTCVGDTVNRAARIEEHTKQLHVPVLLDEDTKAGLSPAVAVRSLGEVTLRGKAIPVHLYTPVAASDGDQSAR